VPFICLYLDRAPKFAHPNGAKINSTNFQETQNELLRLRVGAWPHYYLCVSGSRSFEWAHGPAREGAGAKGTHETTRRFVCEATLAPARREHFFICSGLSPACWGERASARAREREWVFLSGEAALIGAFEHPLRPPPAQPLLRVRPSVSFGPAETSGFALFLFLFTRVTLLIGLISHEGGGVGGMPY
jgi:hypothetical protein